LQTHEQRIAKQAIYIARRRIARSLQTHDQRIVQQAREALCRSATRDRHRREYELSDAHDFRKSC